MTNQDIEQRQHYIKLLEGFDYVPDSTIGVDFITKQKGYEMHISHKKTLWKRRKDFFHLTPLKQNSNS